MDKAKYLSSIQAIGLALNMTHNTVTTDIVGVEPTDTQWRIDHSKEIELLGMIESAINMGTCLLCGGRNKRL
ncbi:hypothetical protein [Methyloglobulus sp.]|uniref:hypothetical protein n=1 Tax=Methyloglobulus sp. TaxID=2518622 RepID=UPI003989A1BA